MPTKIEKIVEEIMASEPIKEALRTDTLHRLRTGAQYHGEPLETALTRILTENNV